MNAHAVFDLLLHGAAVGHLAILGASFQVPARLRWRDELARLSPLNRKLMWVQSSFTVLTIIAFAVLTFVLHDELLRGDRAALALAIFIAVYWLARIGVDAFYFRHADWPQGPWLKLGHAMLVSLFCALAGTYLALVAWHLG